VDHVHHFTGVKVHQQNVVVIADPPGPRISRRQAVLPRIGNPVAARIIRRSETQSDGEAAVAIAIGRIIAADVEDAPVLVAGGQPVVAIVGPPAAGSLPPLDPVLPAILSPFTTIFANIPAEVAAVLTALCTVFTALDPILATLLTGLDPGTLVQDALGALYLTGP